MNNEILNTKIGNPSAFDFSRLTKEQEDEVLSSLFEQLLLFDKITIATNRVNFALVFLINKLGLNTVEKLFDNDYIRLLLWTPVIVSGAGRKKDDGTFDRSTLYGQPPIVAGALGEDDIDPEKNIIKSISGFNIHRDRRRIFTRRVLKSFVVPQGMEYSTDSAKFVIDAYENNNLANLGLPFEKESNQLDFEQRQQLLSLGHKVLETALISKYNLKAYENYEPYQICTKNLENIGNAYNVSENTSSIFKCENLPDLKKLFLSERLQFDDVFKIRHLSNAKYYRKWINNVSENVNAEEISKEYINQIKGSTKFFESNSGKFIKNLGMFGVGSLLGAALAGPTGAAVGAAAGKAAELGLGLLDTFVLDGLLKGKNPSMFIEDLRKRIDNE